MLWKNLPLNEALALTQISYKNIWTNAKDPQLKYSTLAIRIFTIGKNVIQGLLQIIFIFD